jgi:hypothetical protein
VRAVRRRHRAGSYCPAATGPRAPAGPSSTTGSAYAASPCGSSTGRHGGQAGQADCNEKFGRGHNRVCQRIFLDLAEAEDDETQS